MSTYHSAERFQVSKVVSENGKDRLVNGVAFRDKEKAISEAIDHYRKLGGLWIVTDSKPRKRSGGYVERDIVVFTTLGGDYCAWDEANRLERAEQQIERQRETS